MAQITWLETEGLRAIEPASISAQTRRRSGTRSLPDLLGAEGFRDVFEVAQAQSFTLPEPSVTRSSQESKVRVAVDVDDGAEYMLVLRHPSGALTFHDGKAKGADGRRSASARSRPARYTIEFEAPVRRMAHRTARRGGALEWVVDAVVDAVVVKITDFLAEKTVNLAEKAIWKLLKRSPGLHRISQGDEALLLTPEKKIKPGKNGRALLLIHGTFSTTQGSFGDLNSGTFLKKMRDTYGDAIYGFDHFTVSVTPQDNAEDILATLPSEGLDCDVITQSRGGLVLRTLVEHADRLRHGDRFRLGRATLVASPNEGTPLATPDRWQETVGWLANILDLFPPNPVTSNAAMIARWITWFTKFGVAAAEGLDAMNMSGAQIRDLQVPPGPLPGQYSAVVSNFEPTAELWARALDLGLDYFFDGANDLVVPTSGGFRVDGTTGAIPVDQIGCYGPGGNIDPGAEQVHHMNSFARAETQTFLANALLGRPQNLPPFDPTQPLPVSRRSATGDLLPAEAARSRPRPVPGPMADTPQSTPSDAASPLKVAAQPLSSVFELMVIDPNDITRQELPGMEEEPNAVPFVYAAYDGARVIAPFWLIKSPGAGETEDPQLKALRAETDKRRGRIFWYTRRIKDYLDGKPDPELLSDDELRDFGDKLFEVLMPGDVRRLYDTARAREKDRLFMIFTSSRPWVADLPWEFSRDPDRGTYLATQDAHFIRNVMTLTPVEKLAPADRLRMLIVTSDPRDKARLSTVEETAKLRHELRTIEGRGLLHIDELHGATADALHETVSTGNYDILHFIGHGYWNTSTGDSGLVIEDARGNSSFLGGRALRDVLTQRGLRLIFLNACDTGRGRQTKGGSDSRLGGVAQDLFGCGVPNVIANQFPVGDRAAVAFARAIYGYLAQGTSFAQSVFEARIAANLQSDGEALDWAIPVVYARDPEDRFVSRSAYPSTS